jgi:hypothetical protein
MKPKEDRPNNTLAVMAACGAGVLYLIERSRRRYNEAHYRRQMLLAQAKNEALHKYVFDEVRNPNAMKNMIVDAKFIQIVERNNID